MKRALTILFILFIAIITHAQVFSWEWQNPKPSGVDHNAVVTLDANTTLTFGGAGAMQKSTNGGTDWTLSYIDNSYRDIKGAAFVTSTLGYICGTSGLLMKTTNGGASWATLTSGTTEDLLSIDFYDKDTVYASGTNGVLLKTTNGGAAWTVSTYGTSYLYKVYVLSASTIFLGSNNATTGRIIRSTNYGSSWQSVTPAAFTAGIVYGISFGDANNGVAVSSGSNIFKTTDGGATWVNKGTLGSNVMYCVQFISPTKVLSGDVNGSLCVSTDAGDTWSTLSVSSQKIFGIDFYDNTVYACGAAGTIVKSTNSGVAFTNQFSAVTQQILRDLKFFDSKNGLACGGATAAADSIGQMLQTTNGGASWTLLPFNFKTQVYCFARPTPLIWYAATNNNKIFKTTNGGSSFTELTLPITGTAQTYWDIAFSGTDTGYAAGAGGKMIKTTDAGATWVSLNPNVGTNVIYKVKIAGNAVYAAGLGAKLIKSTDGGATWVALNPNIAGTFFALAFKNANVGYVAGSALGAAKTTDAGNTWTALTLPTTLKSTTSIWSIAFGDSTVWMSTINGDVLYSKDDGATWNISKKPTSTVLYSIAVFGNDLWMAGNGGAIIKGFSNPVIPVELTSFTASVSNNNVILNWKTATETNNLGFDVEKKQADGLWQKIGFVKGNGTTADVHNYSFSDQALQKTANYRLKQIDFDGTSKYSSVVEIRTGAPEKFELAQNFPNPFNPVSTINYQIASNAKVMLKVFDVLGKEVSVLVNEVKEAGSYSVQFDASKLSSGVYYYTLTSGSFSNTKKMLLLK